MNCNLTIYLAINIHTRIEKFLISHENIKAISVVDDNELSNVWIDNLKRCHEMGENFSLTLFLQAY